MVETPSARDIINSEEYFQKPVDMSGTVLRYMMR